MILLKNIVLILAIGLISCCASKKSTDSLNPEKSKNESAINSKKSMLNQGYSEGIIIASNEEDDCPFVIKINNENYPYLLDPIDLPSNFQKEGLNIWFKFIASRMAKRCDKANPVSILDIKKRMQ